MTATRNHWYSMCGRWDGGEERGSYERRHVWHWMGRSAGAESYSYETVEQEIERAGDFTRKKEDGGCAGIRTGTTAGRTGTGTESEDSGSQSRHLRVHTRFGSRTAGENMGRRMFENLKDQKDAAMFMGSRCVRSKNGVCCTGDDGGGTGSAGKPAGG